MLLFVPAFMFLWGLQDDVSNHRRRYRMSQLRRVLEEAGFEIERTTYANITFFLPILLMRKLMRLTGIKAESENNINVSALNGVLGRVFGSGEFDPAVYEFAVWCVGIVCGACEGLTTKARRHEIFI